MYNVYFYEDKNGRSEVRDYIIKVSSSKGKDNRIKANKLNDYIEALSRYGLAAGEPYIKHLEGPIWELRPLRDRILFVAVTDNGFVLLHYFMKKTQKTPQREIEKAKRELADIEERGISYGENSKD